jgi:hypothetical protein
MICKVLYSPSSQPLSMCGIGSKTVMIPKQKNEHFSDGVFGRYDS